MTGKIRKILVFNLTLLLFLFPALPLAAGDGMPAIRYGEAGDDPEAVFSSIFESRQLAAIELIDDSHERISLFLSVYSLDPGDNLTILVPLRTLPVAVTGKPIKETDFRDEYGIDKAEKEVIRQDMEVAVEKFGSETTRYFQYAFGSLVWTFMGEYTRQEIRQLESYGMGYYEEDKATGGDGNEYGQPEPVQHYEFDGFSIDVFNVSAGAMLTDYLEEKGLMLPEIGALDRYNDQYVAVIESASKPPISETKFNFLKEYVPNATARLIQELKDDPDKSQSEIWNFKWWLQDGIYNEYWEFEQYQESDEPEIQEYQLIDYMDELVDAVFGETDFEGEVIEVELPLDDGKIFFPLGTSGGWANHVGDIDILFKIPGNKALDLPDSKDAYFDKAHWYLFQLENSNPDYDLESPIESHDAAEQTEMERAGFITDNYDGLGVLVIALIIIIFWFCVAFAVKRFKNHKGEKILRNPKLWLLLGLALVISIPGTILLLLLYKPLPVKRLGQDLMMSTLLFLYPLSIVLFALGVSL